MTRLQPFRRSPRRQRDSSTRAVKIAHIANLSTQTYLFRRIVTVDLSEHTTNSYGFLLLVRGISTPKQRAHINYVRRGNVNIAPAE